MEIRFDYFSHQDEGFCDEYKKYLKDLIEATEVVKLINSSSITDEDHKKINEAL
jgi:hypothetical protein